MGLELDNHILILQKFADDKVFGAQVEKIYSIRLSARKI